ncbi:hypothetical protein H0H93_011674 [Arthromyces matolae]|nr:hypothetical protein H0H93_011674 [Arthromyces matolae]
MSDSDFWEFANCGRCQLPFAASSSATVPFWLTECGHIMDRPMSDWFQSVPIALDSIANAAKVYQTLYWLFYLRGNYQFQHETMAAQIRQHRARYQQQRALVERLKHDISELKTLNDQLQSENESLRQRHFSEQSLYGQHEILNSNGKRPHTDAHAQATHSSPRSITTSLGPNRLTLPQRQTPPALTAPKTDNVHIAPGTTNDNPQPPSVETSQPRPASAFIKKYAYVPPSTPALGRIQPSHAPAGSQAYKRMKHDQEPWQSRKQQLLVQNPASQNMLPPPTPSESRAARPPQTSNQFSAWYHQKQILLPSGKSRQQQRKITGHSSHSARPFVSGRSQNDENAFETSMGNSAPNRFFRSHSPSKDQAPMTSASNGPQRFFSTTTRAPSRAQRLDHVGGGQRVPFIAQDQSNEGYI